MLGCFNPTLGQIWTNPAVGLNFYIAFLSQHLVLSIFDPKIGLKQPSIFVYKVQKCWVVQRVYIYINSHDIFNSGIQKNNDM